ncbi:hypothetical protein K227x_64120 [Rubripirellula lacrimiformis]|uniref:Uncharacterized protein n=1 Tax=Rubripirellula lacrimiformis TaxID=1930273 RepID=A0A517NLI0_9BACT|nr:hypothetical protein K227x_64120 [Rubripirellula lacrimiformis]
MSGADCGKLGGVTRAGKRSFPATPKRSVVSLITILCNGVACQAA